jgi:hypothetical protein
VSQFLKQIALGSLAMALVSAGLLCAKAPVSVVTISGGDLPKRIEITDADAIRSINIWSGPGNFKVENGVRTPIVRDGSIVWSQGIVSEPPKELPEYEISFNGGSSPEGRLYVLRYRYEPSTRFGSVYLPGKGEQWYDVNVHTIYRGVEGHWFRTATAFNELVQPLIEKAKSTDRK